jgi:phosphohistidine phosphatase
MILYLVRHAHAMPVGGGITHDNDRKLSSEGLLDAARLGKLFLVTDPGIGQVLTSPLLRAVQTGQEIARALRSGLTLRTSENLSPGFRSRALREELSALPDGANCVLVGHEPDMSMFLGDLCEAGHRPSIAFPPSAIAAVEMPGQDRSEARVRWLLHPELLALLFPTP